MTQPPTSEYETKRDEIIGRYTDYIECEEWHIHDQTGKHEGETPIPHDFDDGRLKQAIDDLVHEQVMSYVEFYNNKHDTGYSTGIDQESVNEYFNTKGE